jgi:hypothetical protein
VQTGEANSAFVDSAVEETGRMGLIAERLPSLAAGTEIAPYRREGIE